MERLTHNHSEDTSELLSAYSDDAVDVVERRRAEQHLARCAACAQELRELRMLRQMLRDLPSVQPRRSFTIDPATVVPPRRFLFPTLRWASLVATVLLLVLLGVEGLSMPSVPAGTTTMRQSDRSTAQEFAPLLASPAAAPMPDAAASPAPEMPAAEASPESEPMAAMEASPAASPESAAQPSPESAIPESEAAGGTTGAEQPASEDSAAGIAGAQREGDPALKSPAEESLGATGAAQDTEELASLPEEAADASVTQAEQSGWRGLRIAQLITALAAIALSIAAWIAWRRQL